jgi:sugar (pentulose or hexulose) kinase
MARRYVYCPNGGTIRTAGLNSGNTTPPNRKQTDSMQSPVKLALGLSSTGMAARSVLSGFSQRSGRFLNEAPEVYSAADRMIEAADWVVWQLTGIETRNSCTAGYKAMWSKKEGFPPPEFFKSLDPRLENIVDEKMKREILPLGVKAGGISEQAAEWTGLKAGTAVAVANVDAHVAVPAATVTESGRMVMIMGTSICHMVVGESEETVPGMCGVVMDGIVPDNLDSRRVNPVSVIIFSGLPKRACQNLMRMKPAA